MVDQKRKSRDEFIEENLNLVHSLCKRFAGKGIEYDDLFQAGCIGLIKAADGFEPERGFCFSTYAVPVVLGEIRRLFRDGGTVKVSRGLRELFLKITRERERFELHFGREPALSELAQALDVSTEEITEAVCACAPVVSLTQENDGEITEFDIASESTEEALSDKILLSTAFRVLEREEQQLIFYRYYNGYTQNKTAELLGMTQVQVSRSEKKILLKLRNSIGHI